MSVPPFGDRAVPERACSRAIDAAWNPCGKEAFLHVAWRDTPEGIEGGWVCVDHAKDLHTWPPMQTHEPGPDCGMPGSRWFVEDNICRCADPVPEEGIVVTEAIGVEA